LDVALVNRAAIHSIGNPKSILEVGSGTGLFATLAADALPDSKITASEFEDATREWAILNRSRENIKYCRSALSEFRNNEFELVVTLEVIEHIHDYPGFLQELSRVAPKAIISTPNKLRNWYDSIANSPGFEEHVREFSTEAFFWVLRCYWDDVQIYSVPDLDKQMENLRGNPGYQTKTARTGLHCRDRCMFAVCSSPRMNALDQCNVN
jgi:SAM-dependent methyltransferase